MSDEPQRAELPPVTEALPYELAAMLHVVFNAAGFYVLPDANIIVPSESYTLPIWVNELWPLSVDAGKEGAPKTSAVGAATSLMTQLVPAFVQEHNARAADTEDAWGIAVAFTAANQRFDELLEKENKRWWEAGKPLPDGEQDWPAVYTPPADSLLPAAQVELKTTSTALFHAMARWYSQRTGVEPYAPPTKPARRDAEQADTLDEYDVFTSEDMTSYMRAMCAGRSLDGWTEREDDGAMVWGGKGIPFSMEVLPSPRAGLGAAELVAIQSVDSAWVVLYALNVLLKTGTPTPHSTPIVTLDIDDVIEKTRGYVPERPADKERARRETWLALLYGDAAILNGQRTIPYVDRRSGETIATQLSGPLFRLEWQTTRRDGAKGQTSMITGVGSAPPLRTGYSLTRGAYAVLERSGLRQYLPMAERLGAIRGGQPSGDWARAIGLTLFNEWRKKPRGRKKPFTRRELLYTFRPRTNPDEILKSANAARAIEYFQGALQELAGADILEHAGDVLKPAHAIRSGLPLREWAKQWLDTPVDVQPSQSLAAAIKEQADRLPPPAKPKRLNAKPRKRRAKPKTGD